MPAKAVVLLLIVVLILASGASKVWADTPTPTPSKTPTPTLSFEQRQLLATIVPPNSCGLPFSPCGSLPWNIPVLPTFYYPSPTIMPTVPTNTPIPITATPSQTGTPGTATPVPSATPPFDTSSLSTFTGGIDSFSGTLMAQATQDVSIDGTPQSINILAEQIGSGAAMPFAYAKGLQLTNFGGTGGIVSFIILIIAFMLLVKLFLFAFPILRGLLDIVLKVITAFKPF